MIDLFARFSDGCFGKGSWSGDGSLDQAASSAKWETYIIGKLD